jgi:hypothetical protein
MLSTSLSLLFGLYSFYGFINYMDHLEEDMDEMYALKRSFNELFVKHNDLHSKYDYLLGEHNVLKNKFDKLDNMVSELDRRKLALKNCVGETPLEDILENVVDKNRLICYTPDSTSEKPKINIEIINLFVNPEEEKEDDDDDDKGHISDESGKPIDLDGDLDLDETITKPLNNDISGSITFEHGFELLDQSNEINEHIAKSRSRGTSITEINWGEATKRFIFG